MFAVNNKDTRMMSMTMSMFSSVAIVEFEEANVRWNSSFFFGCNFSGISCFLRFVEYPMSVSMDDFLLQHEYISSKILANMAWIFDESFVVCFDCCPRLFSVNKSVAEMSAVTLFYNIAVCVNHSEPLKSVKSANRCRGKKK